MLSTANAESLPHAVAACLAGVALLLYARWLSKGADPIEMDEVPPHLRFLSGR